MLTRLACLATAAATGLASAQTTVVTITLDETSGMSGTISQDAPLVGGSDSFDVGLSGSAVLEIDEDAGTIRLVDFMGMTTAPVSLNYSGFLSNLDINASVIETSYAGSGPTVAVPYAGGPFTINDIPANLDGDATVDANIFGAVTLNEMFSLAEFNPLTLPSFTGTLVETSEGMYELNSNFTSMESFAFEAAEGVTINITIDLTVALNGSGEGVTVGPMPCNAADFAAPFGALDIADVVAFLQAFGAMDPAADLATPTGAFDIADVVTFLQVFGAGCPS